MGGEEREDDVAGLLFLSFPLSHFYLEEFTWGALALGQAGGWDVACLDTANIQVFMYIAFIYI